MERIYDLVIIGGGVAGLTTALCAGRRGLSAHVVERSASPRWQGGGLVLGSNAVSVLERLGLGEAVVRQGVVLERLRFVSREGLRLMDLPIGDLSRRIGVPTLAIARSAVMRALLEAVPEGTITYGRSLVALREEGLEIRTTFADGSTARGRALVGADGIRSTVRELLLGPHEPTPVGQVAWLGLASHVPPTLRDGHALGVVGPDDRFWASAVGPDRSAWYAVMSEPDPEHPRLDDPRRLGDAFEGWHPMIGSLLSATDPDSVLRIPLTDRSPSRHWGVGLATLVGDAAQPVTPDLGQGACQAIEGAAVLVDHLPGGPARTGPSLRRYEEARWHRAVSVHRLCRLVATQSVGHGSAHYDLRNLVLATMPDAIPMAELSWLLDRPAPALRPVERAAGDARAHG